VIRIVARVTRRVQVCAGGVRGLGYRVVWYPKGHHLVLAGWAAGRCGELVSAKVSRRGWPVVALGIMPGYVHLFVKAHSSDSPSQIARQFKCFTSRRLRAGFPRLRSRRPALWPRSYYAAAGAVPAGRVCRSTGMQHGRRWRKGRVR